MTSPRAALYLRKLGRLCPDERRELHRIARMADKAGYADELVRWAWGDVKAARETLRDAREHPDLYGLGDVAAWLGTAGMWLAAAGICALSEDAR